MGKTMKNLLVSNYLANWDQTLMEWSFDARVTLSRNWPQMAIRIWNFQFRAKIAPNLVNSQSTAEASTMPTESLTMAPEAHKKETQWCNFLLRSLPAGNTIASRRQHDGYTTSFWEYDAFELGHEGVPMVLNLRVDRGKFNCWSDSEIIEKGTKCTIQFISDLINF